ncbi:MAG: GDYXXLXY domain-containing protein [Chloroflexota bacterium]|nr:GDYXXLXY domain-containing protein [Chloroflexota bacterium]MDE2961050.1 GDYXXLXY domain-containing protein [Chloroflexota bacterium]
MTRVASILFFAVVAAQVVGLVAFAGVREVALTEGREIILQTAPVDPRSLFQGDYAILDYEIAQVPPWLSGQPAGANVYVILAECGDVWCASRHTRSKPESSDVYIRGVINADGRLDFGIGTYFVPEGTGHIIERAQDVKVIVSLDDRGQAVIKSVLVDGFPFNPDGN